MSSGLYGAVLGISRSGWRSERSPAAAARAVQATARAAKVTRAPATATQGRTEALLAAALPTTLARAAATTARRGKPGPELPTRATAGAARAATAHKSRYS